MKEKEKRNVPQKKVNTAQLQNVEGSKKVIGARLEKNHKSKVGKEKHRAMIKRLGKVKGEVKRREVQKPRA